MMTTVLDELSVDEGKLERADIERRVANWKTRLNSLYDNVTAWLPNGFGADRTRSVIMHEEIMKAYSVPATQLPLLVFRSEESFGKMIPLGLWIIGVNGRVDLYIDGRHFLIVDRAANFSEPDWQLAPAEDRRRLRPFDKNALENVIAG